MRKMRFNAQGKGTEIISTFEDGDDAATAFLFGHFEEEIGQNTEGMLREIDIR